MIPSPTADISETNRDPSQASLILARLKQTPGEWVPMPELYRVSGAFAVHSRISDLRADGYQIENRVSGLRPRTSYFRLIDSTMANATTHTSVAT